ncbi:MAG: FAD binding domain-containing protein [Anaerolineales bacterium]
MIVEYYRPKNIAETLSLLSETQINTVLMGGGTAIDRYSTEPFAVLDLQDVGLSSIQVRSSVLEIGATATLQALYEYPQIQEALISSIYHEATQNLRQVATAAGTLIAADGRSPFTTAMYALDAALTIIPDEEQISLGDLLALGKKSLAKRLITKITIPLNVRLAYEYVARTPADLPIVCAAVAVWPSGRTRVVLGGYGEEPILAMDGPDGGGAEIAAKDAYSLSDDQWATAEYRQEMAKVLVKRGLVNLEASSKSKE